jgi:hypothetical protein
MHRFRAFLSAIVVLALAPSAAGASNHFFPKRPVDIVPSHVTGVLVNYAHGEAVGGFAILDDAGKTWSFSMGYRMTVNGTAVRCFRPPASSKPAFMCDDWPAGVIVGTTRVTAAYWKTTGFDGSPIFASDELVTAGLAVLT